MIIDKQVYKDLVKPLGKDIHKRFCTNIDNAPYRERIVLSASGAIMHGFIWSQSPEGWDFWNNVFLSVLSSKPLLSTLKVKKQRYEEVVF